MKKIINLSRYPLDRPNCDEYAALVTRCQADLLENGMFNLEAFISPKTAQIFADNMKPAMQDDSFTHKRRHNIYFKNSVPGISPDHPAMLESDTINHTLCADQIAQNGIIRIYEWPPFVNFLSKVMNRENLYQMADKLARVNVMAYRTGEALNWHFDRSEFTTTLLLQAPQMGGVFQYRTDLRTPVDPNYEGVAKLLKGEDAEIENIKLSAGTLNVFRGINTPHRVTPVIGNTDRMIAVFSYYESPNITFSDEERISFYGRQA